MQGIVYLQQPMPTTATIGSIDAYYQFMLHTWDIASTPKCYSNFTPQQLQAALIHTTSSCCAHGTLPPFLIATTLSHTCRQY